MGLDIYAGTLTRYYAHNWKTATQQWAEENGYIFHRITLERDEAAVEEEMTPVEIQNNMENWQAQLLAAISDPGREPYAPWQEDNERPYYTNKPGWEAFEAMLLVGACHIYGEPVPATMGESWNYAEDSPVARLAEDQERIWSLFRGATCWLPISERLFVQGPLPTGTQAVIATLGGLRMELESLNEMVWQADEDTILDWVKTEGYPVDGVAEPNVNDSKADISEDTQCSIDSLAKFAFSVFWQAMRFAEEHQVPILLDY